MRLFILGAGQGIRLAPETEDAPKCLVDLGDGTTFLSRLVEIAKKMHYINEVNVITGHGSDRVEEAVSEEAGPVDLRMDTLYNPFYEVAGPIVSLWVAHDRMEDKDFLVCNGDTLYNERPFELLWSKDEDTIRLCVDEISDPAADDMKVKTDGKGRLIHVGKDISPGEADAVSIGLLMVKGEQMRQTFATAIVELMHKSENVHKWQVWHKVLNKLASDGVSIETVPVKDKDWVEVDTLEELEHLRDRLDHPENI